MTIEILSRPTKRDVEDINALLPQIAKRPHFIGRAELVRIVGQKSCRFLVARTRLRSRSVIVGMGTLILVHIPTGLVAVIEDVVVDEHFRGLGIGKRLVRKLILFASAMKAKHVSLSTNPKRRAANALYQRLGFFRKKTNFYRIHLCLPKPARKSEIKKLFAKRAYLFGESQNGAR